MTEETETVYVFGDRLYQPVVEIWAEALKTAGYEVSTHYEWPNGCIEWTEELSVLNARKFLFVNHKAYMSQFMLEVWEIVQTGARQNSAVFTESWERGLGIDENHKQAVQEYTAALFGDLPISPINTCSHKCFPFDLVHDKVPREEASKIVSDVKEKFKHFKKRVTSPNGDWLGPWERASAGTSGPWADYAQPRTFGQLTRRRRMQTHLHGVDAFTCDECGLVTKCVFAFDPYNTNGDCLAEK